MKNTPLKTVLITGSGSGIGYDTAFALARRGFKVLATTETTEQSSALQASADQEKLPIESFKLDVTQPEDRQQIETRHIDILINNAATGQSGPMADVPIGKIKYGFEVNLFAPIQIAQIVLKKMLERNTGTVIFISSTAGRIVVPFLGPYCMTKFALSSGAKAMRQEINTLKKNVHICVVEPGAYHTGFNQKLLNTQFDWLDQSSQFYPLKTKIKQRLELMFKTIEVGSTQSIVRQIVKAATSSQPKFRYGAPWWQTLGVRVLRMFGQ